MPATQTLLVCPRDGAAMQPQTLEHATIDHCPTCRGTWFDHHELRRVAHDKELEQLALRPRTLTHATMPCPRCGTTCREGWIADVQVDTCDTCHGVWLDQGELREATRQLEERRLIAGEKLGFLDFLRRL